MKDFKELELNDRGTFRKYFDLDSPQGSELTFTNLFMWRFRYHPIWTIHDDCLFIIMRPEDQAPFGLQPVGPGDKGAALEYGSERLAEISEEVRFKRVTETFVNDHVAGEAYDVTEDRDHSDYVYLAEDLIELKGNKFHSKKNHVNRFVKNNEYEYRVLDDELLDDFLELQSDWCELKDCDTRPGLFDENVAIREALVNYKELGFHAAAILVDAKVEAFAMGERLNPDTAVIHVEKANPEISGLYAAINQIYCEKTWSDVTYINREQDLGVEGLRKAKLSYNPDHMVRKYTLSKAR